MRKLRPHQKRAVQAIIKGLKTADRGQAIMATGSGKTLVALRVVEALKPKRVLVLLPSLSLLAQTLREWQMEPWDFDFLTVCSDESVVADDALVMRAEELGVPTTLDTDEIRRFLRSRRRPQVVFSTYQSSRLIDQAQKGGAPTFDIIICDEAHRTTGPRDSSFAVPVIALKGRKRLFMTATPKSYSTGSKSLSMDNPKLYGEVLHSYSFGQAIQDDVLCDYEVAVVVIAESQMAAYLEDEHLLDQDGHELNAHELASQIGLVKAMREYSLHRVVTFHSTVKRAAKFARTLPATVHWMEQDERPKAAVTADYVSGAMRTDERAGKIEQLGTASDGQVFVLSNARCLAEGVDVPTLDAVAFVDPKSSQIDITQGLGRVVRKAEHKTRGVIVLPLFVADGEDVEVHIDASAYRHVWNVMRSLRTLDPVMAYGLDKARDQLERQERPDLPVKVTINAPAGTDDRLLEAVTVKLVEIPQKVEVDVDYIKQLHAEGLGWTAICRRLEAEGVRNAYGGTTWNPTAIREYVLGKTLAKKGSKSRTDRWMEKYNVLVEWCEVIGPLEKRNLGMEPEIARWMQTQKQQQKSGHARTGKKLAPERVRLLEALPGWRWYEQ